MRTDPHAGSEQGGFTLLELMIVVSILAIIASIGVPQYVGALRTARIGKAKHELRTISNAVDSFTANNGGQLPLSLYQVGFGGKRDPWGVPYCFLNYTDGTGDGLEWAIDTGIVDPSAFSAVDSESRGGDGGPGFVEAGFSPVLPQERIPVDYDLMETKIGRQLSITERGALADAVEKNSGTFSFFTGVAVETTRRRDRYLFPLNTDYDLFSLGPDHQTAVSLGESTGLDDVIRANNGGFFGVASEY